MTAEDSGIIGEVMLREKEMEGESEKEEEREKKKQWNKDGRVGKKRNRE